MGKTYFSLPRNVTFGDATQIPTGTFLVDIKIGEDTLQKNIYTEVSEGKIRFGCLFFGRRSLVRLTRFTWKKEAIVIQRMKKVQRSNYFLLRNNLGNWASRKLLSLKGAIKLASSKSIKAQEC